MTDCRCGRQSFGFSGCYWCLKLQHFNGGGLGPDEITFIGFDETPPTGDRWHHPDAREDPTEAWMTDADLRLLQILVDAPNARPTG